MIRIHVPPRLNRAYVSDFADALGSATGPLVLLGDADCFCHGIDLQHLLENDGHEVTKIANRFIDCLNSIHQHNAPTFAYVEGSVFGGGLGIVAACDIVAATENAVFGLPELLYGFIPGIILPYLLERMSKQAIRRLAFSGTPLKAAVANSIGLVDELIADKPEKVIAHWSRTIARIDRIAVNELRSLLNTVVNPTDQEWRASCTKSSLEIQMNVEKREALSLYLQEGIPPWENRG